jgi:hypothetical protein
MTQHCAVGGRAVTPKIDERPLPTESVAPSSRATGGSANQASSASAQRSVTPEHPGGPLGLGMHAAMSFVLQLVQILSSRNQPKSIVKRAAAVGLAMFVYASLIMEGAKERVLVLIALLPVFTLAMVGVRWIERRVEERQIDSTGRDAK